MAKPRALILTGYGINCDDETAFAFERAGAESRILHINDLIENPRLLDECQIFVFPGGFSYGDDTGSGKALANRIRNNLSDEIRKFIERDTLVLGICNGFQVMVNLGMVPGLGKSFGEAEVSLEQNRSFRYQCLWVNLKIEQGSPSVFTRGIDLLHIPVAHGEGNFYAPDHVLDAIEREKLVAMRYALPDGTHAGREFPFNPNYSMNDIASVSDSTGRLLGMMPHPERGMFFTQRDDWTLLREKMRRNGETIPEESGGIMIFKNAVKYYSC